MSKAEMSHRHNVVDREVKIREGSGTKLFTIDILTLIFAFTIITGGGYATFYLVINGFNIAGSLFGGATLLLSAKAFLNFRSIRTKR
jgi:uncharacterized membrane protein